MKKTKRRNWLAPFLMGCIFLIYECNYFVSFKEEKNQLNKQTSQMVFSQETTISPCNFFAERLPFGVTIDGIKVGGKKKEEALKILRENKISTMSSLNIKTQKQSYVFSYPEIDFTDNLPALLLSAQNGKNYEGEYHFYLHGVDSVCDFIASNDTLPPLDAEITFNQNGFSYEKEQEGYGIDKAQLKKDILFSLSVNEQFPLVMTKREKLLPTLTLAQAKKDTVLISRFTTYFQLENQTRSHNIALAASKIDGLTINSGEEFSFNQIVGKRSELNGFLSAPIIQDGELVEGLGGGVCQVSTTLYNAVLLAGMAVIESRSHSLQVHYVEPSFDAMISSGSDLKFVNTRTMPVYLRAKVQENALIISFYGQDNGYVYQRQSVIKKTIEPPLEKVIEGEEEKVIREGQKGIVSEGYLLTYKDGIMLKRQKLRTDYYAPVQRIVQHSTKKVEQEELPLENEKQIENER